MCDSRLCKRISLSESLEQLNHQNELSERTCIDVIRLLQTHLGHGNGNMFLVEIIMKMTHNCPIETLDNIQKDITDMVDKASGNKGLVKSTKATKHNNDRKDTTFPLLRLPIDIKKKTSLFLNEKDIFNYEKCCRLFYKMINNNNYLNKTNNFKRFKITMTRLSQMANKNCLCSFYKLPIDILFDETKSNLKRIFMNHFWNNSNNKCLEPYLEEFNKQYLNLQKKLNTHNKKLKKLLCVEHTLC